MRLICSRNRETCAAIDAAWVDVESDALQRIRREDDVGATATSVGDSGTGDVWRRRVGRCRRAEVDQSAPESFIFDLELEERIEPRASTVGIDRRDHAHH